MSRIELGSPLRSLNAKSALSRSSSSCDTNCARLFTISFQRSFSVAMSQHDSILHVDHASAFDGERPFHLSHQIHSAPAMCTSVPKIVLRLMPKSRHTCSCGSFAEASIARSFAHSV